MAWVCVDAEGLELIFEEQPIRIWKYGAWVLSKRSDGIGCIELPSGSIKKLIGRELTWNDEPVMLEEE